MEFEKFLNKWYDLKVENVLNEKNEINLSINELFPGNLKKILTKIRNLGMNISNMDSLSKYFYSYKKELYIETSFVYFEFICYVVNRINFEIPNLFCNGIKQLRENDVGSKETFLDAREYMNLKEHIEDVNLKKCMKEFWNNGDFKLSIKKENGDVETESFLIEGIINDGIQILLTKIEGIINGKEPIYSNAFVIKDKETNLLDLKINLNFYTQEFKITIENPNNLEISEIEKICKTIEESNLLQKYYKDSIGCLNYDSHRSVNDIKKRFGRELTYYFKNYHLFDINTGDVFKINSMLNTDGYFSNDKNIVNNGTISASDFLKIKKDLEFSGTYSKLLLNAIN